VLVWEVFDANGQPFALFLGDIMRGHPNAAGVDDCLRPAK
jgi:hypothetical protein